MYSYIDRAERGQVPNASQLDSAQSQADKGGRRWKQEGEQIYSSHKSHHLHKITVTRKILLVCAE